MNIIHTYSLQNLKLHMPAEKTGDIQKKADRSISVQDAVSISRDSRVLAADKKRIQGLKERLEKLPEVRENILLQAHEKMLNGVFNTKIISEKCAEIIAGQFGRDVE